MPRTLARPPFRLLGITGGPGRPGPDDLPPYSGTTAPGYEPVAAAFGEFLAGDGRGGALTVRRGTQTLVDVWTGWADPRSERAWTPDTPALSFSTTKGVTATAIHVLADRGLVSYDEPVATYWPEFAARGKEAVTLRDVLSHRAGLHDVRSLARDASELLDAEIMEDRLAAAKPSGAGGVGGPYYHAYTFGWLCGGIIRRVTGKPVAEAVRDLIADPLGLTGLDVGLAPVASTAPPPAEVVGSALRLYGATERFLTPIWGNVPLTRASVRALVLPGLDSLVYGRSARIWKTQMPAVNGAFTARALAGMYGALANGGALGDRRILCAATVNDAGKVQTRERDRVLGLAMRWRLGYHHAFMAGAPARQAFGHYGFGGSGGWADPESGLSFGYVTNDIGALTSPVGDRALFRMSGLVRECSDRQQRVQPATGASVAA